MNSTQSPSAILWSLAERIGTQGFRILFTLALLRALAPEHFGIVGLIGAFISIAETLTNGGMSLVLVRESTLSDQDRCSAFVFSLTASLVLFASLWLAAPMIARLYEVPSLTSVTRALALGIPIKALAIVPNADLMRKLAFDSIAKVSLISTFVSGTTAVAMAYGGFGVWSIVTQQILGDLMFSACLYARSPWRPRVSFDPASLRRLLPLGASLTLISLMDSASSSIFMILLGQCFQLRDVGIYSRAQQLPELAVKNFYYAVSRPTLRVFAKVQDDPVILSATYERTASLLAFASFPMMAILAATASPITYWVFNDAWVGAAPIIRGFCIIGALFPIQRITFNLMVATGRRYECIKMESFRNSCFLASLGACWHGELLLVVLAQSLGALFSYAWSLRIAARALGVSALVHVSHLIPYFAASVFSGLAAFALQQFLEEHPVLGLVLPALLGCSIYLMICAVFRLSGLAEAQLLITGLRRRDKGIPT